MTATLSDAALDDLDARLQHAARTGDTEGLSVLGYGEVTTVVGVHAPEGEFAVKGLPTFLDEGEARRHVETIARYTAALTERGITVVHTDARVRPQDDGTALLYLVQPMLPPGSLGPDHFGRLDADGCMRLFDRIVDTLQGSVSETVTPDGQLSNWAIVDGELQYLDVSTPFLRETDGSLSLDWRFFVDAHPRPLRPIIRALLPGTVGKYFSLRMQVVDHLANLIKEGLGAHVTPLAERANGRCDFDRPITDKEVRRYYAEDARTYAALLSARRLDRLITTKVLGKPYPFLVPPKFDRHPEQRDLPQPQ